VSAEPSSREDLGRLLNTLLEAERAGAKLLSAYMDQLPGEAALRAVLAEVQRDEARNCAVLMDCLARTGVEASRATGSFFERGLAIEAWPERLAFLNRGQGWVARRIAEALPRIDQPAVHEALKAMHASHLENIARCEDLSPA
jgi:nitronate monooxygenase